MSELLTTKELRDLLRVDRITIYRMLEQGRLPGFKVGGQWRFSRQEIEEWLDAQRELLPADADASEAAALSEGDSASLALPLHCIQAMQGIFAETVDAACITVALDGEPLTEIQQSCRFCDLIQSTAEGRERCQASWREIAQVLSRGEQGPHKCHAGLSYAAGPVHVDGETLAATLAGQILFSQPEGEEWETRCRKVAANCNVSASQLLLASETIHVHEPEWAPRLLHLVQRLVSTFSQIGEERQAFLTRLQRIAEITKV